MKALLTVTALILARAFQGQPPTSQPQLSAVTHTAYSANTELFAEWRPFIVGQPTRLTAHLTHTGERFQAFADGRVDMTLTIEDTTTKATADAPERAGVFRLNVTPTTAGTGRAEIDVAAGGTKNHFVIDNVPVYPDLASATAARTTGEPGLIGYAKDKSLAEDFATAPVTTRYQGRMVLVPIGAVVHDGQDAFVFVQHTPERFELRKVTLGSTFDALVQVSTGLRNSDRVVVRGADKMPRK